MLCLRGEHSDLLLPETADAMRNRGPRAVVVEIAGCGHAPALNTPEQFALVERFFAACLSHDPAAGVRGARMVRCDAFGFCARVCWRPWSWRRAGALPVAAQTPPSPAEAAQLRRTACRCVAG